MRLSERMKPLSETDSTCIAGRGTSPRTLKLSCYLVRRLGAGQTGDGQRTRSMCFEPVTLHADHDSNTTAALTALTATIGVRLSMIECSEQGDDLLLSAFGDGVRFVIEPEAGHLQNSRWL
jgi:hypothetical protein